MSLRATAPERNICLSAEEVGRPPDVPSSLSLMRRQPSGSRRHFIVDHVIYNGLCFLVSKLGRLILPRRKTLIDRDTGWAGCTTASRYYERRVLRQVLFPAWQ
jgi:hypothetical protein